MTHATEAYASARERTQTPRFNMNNLFASNSVASQQAALRRAVYLKMLWMSMRIGREQRRSGARYGHTAVVRSTPDEANP